jgi:glutamate dehydrogenase (NADP+)
MKLTWSSSEVDGRLHEIMCNIHSQCVKYGKRENGYVDYVRGANIAGFLKVANAMLDLGVI